MIKIVDAGLYEMSQPRIRFYDTEANCFVKNTAENRRNALFSMLLKDSRFDIEAEEIEKYAKMYVDLLKRNQQKEYIGIDDVDEFVDDLETTFNLKYVNIKHTQIFEELATVVVCDQKKPELAYKPQDFAKMVKSVAENDLYQM